MIGTNRRSAMKQTQYGDFIVSSDGRTVWVNSSMLCVGRFCPNSMEFYPKGHEIASLTGLVVKKFKDTPVVNDWDKFKEDVRREYCISISDEHKPYYIK